MARTLLHGSRSQPFPHRPVTGSLHANSGYCGCWIAPAAVVVPCLVVRFSLPRRARGARVRDGRARLFAFVAVSCGLVIVGCGSSTASSSDISSAAATHTSSAPGDAHLKRVRERTRTRDRRPAGRRASRRFPVSAAHGRSLEALGRIAKSRRSVSERPPVATPPAGAALPSPSPSTRRIPVRADRCLHRRRPDGSRPGSVSRPRRPDGSRLPLPQQAEHRAWGIQAIYAAHLPLPHSGTFAVLSLTHTPHGYVGAPGEVAVARSSPIPDVGQHPPRRRHRYRGERPR